LALAFDGTWLWCGDSSAGVAYPLHPEHLAGPAEVSEAGPEPRALPGGVALVDLAVIEGDLVPLADDRVLYSLAAPPQEPVKVKTQGEREGICGGGEDFFFSLEGKLLVRRDPADFSNLYSVPIESDCLFLASDSGLVYRYCGTDPDEGGYKHFVGVYDGLDDNYANLENELVFSLSASLLSGIEVARFDGKLNMWVIGRGQGEKAEMVSRYELVE